MILLAREQNADKRGLASGRIEDYGLVYRRITVLGGRRIAYT